MSKKFLWEPDDVIVERNEKGGDEASKSKDIKERPDDQVSTARKTKKT
jgi:hypothetical protein